MSANRRSQLSVLAGMLAGAAVSFAVIWAGYGSLAQSRSFGPDAALSLALAFAGLSLLIGIGGMSALRFLGPRIDGSAPESGSRLEMLRRYNLNTSEQALLFALAAIALYLTRPGPASNLLPVMGVWFLVARLAFLAGYLLAPPLRAFGFASTFYPTLALYALVLIPLI